MKNISSHWDNVKNFIYKHYGQESGKMIVHAGVITWIISSVAQIVAIAANDKIPSRQKKFLVPQEIADGALNVLAFYMITNSLKNIAGKLVSTGKWSTKAIRDFVRNKNIKLGDMSTDLGKTFRENEEFHNKYDSFKGGMDMIAATVGSVVSCNVMTPVIRNKIGAKKQKESIAKMPVITKTSTYTYNMQPYTRTEFKV